MPMRWSVPVHEAAVQQLASALRDPDRAGAVVLGPDGVGKSTLALTAVEDFSDAHPDAVIRWVTGTSAERVVPFGAFSDLLEVAEIGKPAALLRAARSSLAVGPGDLLVVDDAQHLDQLSATLVYQLARAGQTRMIITVGAGATSDELAALWTDDLLVRIDLTGDDAAASDGRDVDTFLAELPAGARTVLNYLSIQEPLALADLQALSSAEAVDEATSAGAVEVHLRGRDADHPMVFTAHPSFAARAHAALGTEGARRLRTELVARLAARCRDHPSDRLRLASLALDSATPQSTAEIVTAASEALRLSDVLLAERLARAAVADPAAPLAARLLLAHAMGWQGRGRDAADVLAAVDPGTLSEPELMAWAIPLAANQFWMLGEPERATAFLRTTRSRLTEPAAAATIDALSATFAMNAGAPQRALQIATEVLSSPAAGDMAVAWAASAAALCSARMGRFADVAAFAERADAAEHPGLLRFTVGLGRTTTLLMAGDLDGAEQMARRYTDFAELQQPGRAIGEVLLAQVLIARGGPDDLAAATALLRPASTTLDRTGYSWGPLSLMLLATALSGQGELTQAAKVLSRAASRHGTKSALFAPELGLARAWRLAAARDGHGAVSAARQAAGMAERSGQNAVALRAWHDAVRLGDLRAADPLARLSAETDCVVGRLAAEHGRALTAGEGAALRAVAAELSAIGLVSAAVDAEAQASRPRADNLRP
ncbi:ATP-binding protein [Mycolicibacterium komossense]|uniref:AAA family ATPase n=1 Tax=Mycolicibacterium komossense TaxID=1779 RepID=A0ABT3CKD6_9MYCO|nr:ATP-binding protein [Mycolicibacterium komossense]MCV7229895.1 AAA family ATPase [Mycolicibacterium komossense]